MNCEVRLRVQTVPVPDPITHEDHIAYTVLCADTDRGMALHAPGWTLRDAIDNYCSWFKVDRSSIRLIRPFSPQRLDSYD